jgi:PAS domain S-box-containing protein
MAEGLAIIEISGKINYVNQMAARILGMDPKEITERTYDDPRWDFRRIDGTELPASEHPMARMIQSRSVIYDQEIALQRDGDKDLCYISVNGAPIFDEDDNLIGGVTTFMDVTQRRRLLQHMDEFISVASHELKTPVTSLKAAIQLLQRMKEKPSPDKMFPMIEQAAKSLDKLSGLIDDLLNFTQIGQTEIPLRKSRFTLASMIGDCCTHIRHLGSHTIIVDGDLELEVYADQQRLDQVMVNLVNNAVKYAPASDEISVEIRKLDGMAKVSVTDRGSGIPPEKLEHLFDRYYRGAGGLRPRSGPLYQLGNS